MVYVHIIEVRDLKGEDPQGTSDPVVHVDVFGRKCNTEVKKDCLSAVFDETFVVPLQGLETAEFEEGVIRVAVLDADLTVGSYSAKTDLIGAVSFDASYVYFHKVCGQTRVWVML
ncbi:unnamed protein product, partial [Discosporangium mesarthrocarpum]